MLEATCYLTLEPQYRSNRLTGFRVSKVTQSRPSTADHAQARVMRARVRIPRSAFDEIEATIDVPEQDVEAVVTVSPHEPTPEEA